jgi:hypothetical protein
VTAVGLAGGCVATKPAAPERRYGESSKHPVQPRAVAAPAPAASQPAPDPVPSGPLIGLWHGPLKLTISQKGQAPLVHLDVITFEVESGPGEMVTFWPKAAQKDPNCRFVASVTGMRATFKRQKVCTVEQVDTVRTLSIKSGTLEQRGNTLSVNLVLDASVLDKARKTNTPMKDAMTYSGSGTLVTSSSAGTPGR